jgi:type II secretory pathway pseudopilin PulG
MPSGSRAGEAGFSYVAMLLAVAVVGLGLVATAQVWSQWSQREKEQELLFAGNQFRMAIERYHNDSPGAAKRYPRSLEQLLQDNRHITVKRHLRKIYRDPISGKPEWGLITAPDGAIMGVHSLSQAAPIKTAGFLKRDEAFKGATRYADWRFVYEPVSTPERAAQAPRPK